MQVSVTTTTLDLQADKPLPAIPRDRPYRLMRSQTVCPELNRFLYAAVGFRWCWYERLAWDYATWLDYLDDPDVATWIGYQARTPIGYFELDRDAAGSCDVAYFGLLPSAIGKGLGAILLSDAITAARGFGNGHVWVHTCTLDHPAALPNYLDRGFEVREVTHSDEELPDEPLQPWQGANLAVCRT